MKIIRIMFLSIFIIFTSKHTTNAKSQTIYITIPKFNVTINNEVIENQYSKYPLIVYNDITYFPMTYNNSRFLGVETNWTEEDGLTINRGISNNTFNEYKTKTKNVNNYIADIADIKVKVNNRNIDNSKEEYPLLIFRNITYFPMTWNFAVNEFGWQYSFSDDKGLIINSSPTINNIKNMKIQPIDIYENKVFFDEGVYFVKDGSCFFMDTNNKSNNIYTLPDKNLDVSFEKYGDGVFLRLKSKGEKLFSQGNIVWLNKNEVKEIKSPFPYTIPLCIDSHIFLIDSRSDEIPGKLYDTSKNKFVDDRYLFYLDTFNENFKNYFIALKENENNEKFILNMDIKNNKIMEIGKIPTESRNIQFSEDGLIYLVNKYLYPFNGDRQEIFLSSYTDGKSKVIQNVTNTTTSLEFCYLNGNVFMKNRNEPYNLLINGEKTNNTNPVKEMLLIDDYIGISYDNSSSLKDRFVLYGDKNNIVLSSEKQIEPKTIIIKDNNFKYFDFQTQKFENLK